MSVKVLPAIDLIRPSNMERHSSEPPSSPSSFLHQLPTSPSTTTTSPSPLSAPQKRPIVVVLGGSFSGAHCAHYLAKVLPRNALLILIEQSSHMIHRFVLPRYSVYPSHEHKAFIPYSQLLHNNNDAHQHPSHCESRVIQAKAVRITNCHIDLDRSVKGFGTRVPYTYLVYALGAKLPGFLSAVVDSDKCSSTNWIKTLQLKIAKSTKVVVVGGGALGIQFASDIKERFPGKEVTLIHSRDRFLPLYDPQIHTLIRDRLKALGVDIYFNERVTSSLSVSEGLHTVTTSSGLNFECDLQLNCTGLSYNSSLLASLSPQSLNIKNNCLHVLPTLQLADSRYPNIFVIGDVADTSALKNAVSGWFQGETVARNISHLVAHPETLTSPENEDELESYVAGSPVIKLTVGKNTYVYQRPNAETGEPEIGVYEAKEDLDAATTWDMYGADTKDLFA